MSLADVLHPWDPLLLQDCNIVKSHLRGRNGRKVEPCLPTFVASNAPATLKTAVQDWLADLDRLRSTDTGKSEIVIPPCMLLRLANILPCRTTSLALDFVRVVRHGAPLDRSVSRKYLGAALRDKRTKLGRAPTSSDFPADHPVMLFSFAYWGGIEAWSAGIGDRIQQPKGYWRDPANQLAAIQAFAQQHKGEPITHAHLNAAGLHALVKALNASALTALVEEAGLSRNLRHLSHQAERWTADAVIVAYAALCETWNVTLSNHALSVIGGQAGSLRVHAQRAFGTFGRMQDAAFAAYPTLARRNQPIAMDGTGLDSWSEVIVWNAVRAAFPNAKMRAHAILPGELRRSADILIEDRVYVEVLSYSLAEIATLTTPRAQNYAAKWTRKSEIYQAAGINPIIVDPADVHDPARLADRVAEISRRLGTEPVPSARPCGRESRAKGYWSFETLCDAVAEVAQAVGAYPTFAQLTAAGFGHAAIMLRQPGMRARVAATLGLTLINEKGLWSRERVVVEILAWVAEHGRYPGHTDLVRSFGQGGLACARSRLWRGEFENLRLEIEKRSGLLLPAPRAPQGTFDTFEGVAASLRPLCETLGRMPTGSECAKAGLSTAWAVASVRWGVAAVADALGYTLTVRQSRQGKSKQRACPLGVRRSKPSAK